MGAMVGGRIALLAAVAVIFGITGNVYSPLGASATPFTAVLEHSNAVLAGDAYPTGADTRGILGIRPLQHRETLRAADVYGPLPRFPLQRRHAKDIPEEKLVFSSKKDRLLP